MLRICRLAIYFSLLIFVPVNFKATDNMGLGLHPIDSTFLESMKIEACYCLGFGTNRQEIKAHFSITYKFVVLREKGLLTNFWDHRIPYLFRPHCTRFCKRFPKLLRSTILFSMLIMSLTTVFSFSLAPEDCKKPIFGHCVFATVGFKPATLRTDPALNYH